MYRLGSNCVCTGDGQLGPLGSEILPPGLWSDRRAVFNNSSNPCMLCGCVCVVVHLLTMPLNLHSNPMPVEVQCAITEQFYDLQVGQIVWDLGILVTLLLVVL